MSDALRLSSARSRGHLLLALQVSTGLFLGAAVLAGRAWWSVGRPAVAKVSPVDAGLRMRRILVKMLFAATVVRFLSLIAELAFEKESQEHAHIPFVDKLDNDQQEWLREFVWLFPAMVFLSAFSVVVLFWVQLHFTTTIVPLPLLECLFVCANIACYLLVAAISVCTFLLQAYKHLREYFVCIIGFLNAILAVSFMQYGITIWTELSDSTHKKLPPGKKLTSRVLVISVICFMTLLIRGTTYLASGFSLGRVSRSFDLVLCLIGELVPAVATLLVISPLHTGGARNLQEPIEESTDSELDAPLLLGETSATPQRPPLEWKQLYPQLEKV